MPPPPGICIAPLPCDLPGGPILLPPPIIGLDGMFEFGYPNEGPGRDPSCGPPLRFIPLPIYYGAETYKSYIFRPRFFC